MTEKPEDAVADIAWMRRLAEEGSQAPMQGASILMAAGLIYGLGSLIHWAVVSGRIAIEEPMLSFIWLGATALFLAFLTFAILRLKRSGGVTTAANRASGTAWASVGWGIFAFSSAMAVVGMRLGEQAAVVSLWLMPSMIMVFYGMGWAVTAAMLKSRNLWFLAIGSFVAAPALAAFAGENAQYLAYAAALFLLMALPGWLLMRAARR